MLGLLIVSIIIGAIVAGITNIGFLFWVITIGLFICGLPFALITGFIHGENKYAQDRADYRECMREIAEDERALERELAEDERLDRYISALENKEPNKNIYIDNRQIHINNHKPRRKRRLT